MPVYLAPTFGAGYQAFDTSGLPLNGGFISTFAAGTATPASTWTTSTGLVANPVSIQLGTDGRPPNEIWLTGATTYLFQLFTSSGVSIKSYDNLYGIGDPAFTPNFPWVVAGGSGDAITATYSLNSSYADGDLRAFRAIAVNTSATPTFSADGGIARTITKLGGAAVQPGDIRGATAEPIVRYNLANTRWEMLNPALISEAVSTVASASTVNLDAASADYVILSGTSAISSFVLGNGVMKQTEFTSTLILTSTASLALQGIGQISTVAGDVAVWRGESGGVTRLVQYQTLVGRSPSNTSTFSTIGAVGYIPTTGAKRVRVIAIGGGGGGGGAASTGGGQISMGAGGGAGGLAIGSFFVSTFTSLTVTIGSSGAGSSGASGASGGVTTFGALLTANGGTGGTVLAAQAAPGVIGGSAGGTASGGGINITGASGSGGFSPVQGNIVGGYGGSTQYGAGGTNAVVGTGGGNAGNAAVGFGAGGGGAVNDQSLGAKAGGSGGSGLVLIEEYFV